MWGLSEKRLRALLIASLAINLFFAGLVSARVVLGIDLPGLSSADRRGYRDLPHPRALRAALPEADQSRLEAALDAHREDVRQRFRSLNVARERVAAAIRANPFNPETLDIAFADLRREDAGTAEAIHRMLSALIVDLSAESRAEVAGMIRVWHPRDRKGSTGESTQ